MSARQDIAAMLRATARHRVNASLDGRALRILVDGLRHEPQAVRWALNRVPHMAGFTAGELALGSYEVHRS